MEKTFKELKATIDRIYNEGCTIIEAERLAARTLSIRLDISDRIKEVDLDARMKRHGVKAIRAQAYMDELVKYDKKPAEGLLDHAVNLSELVSAAEGLYSSADTEVDRLKAYLDVFKDAHLYFRNIARGTYEG
jgi:hypothetical protein